MRKYKEHNNMIIQENQTSKNLGRIWRNYPQGKTDPL